MTEPTIHVLMGRVLADIDPVPKDQENPEQRFKYRSIDQIYGAVNKALAKHQVFYVPAITDLKFETYQTKSGTTWRRCLLEATYTFYGPSGDSLLIGPYYGEGSDNGDKVVSKAQTVALKYMLLHTFCIPTAELAKEDADGHTPEAAVQPPPEWLKVHIEWHGEQTVVDAVNDALEARGSTDGRWMKPNLLFRLANAPEDMRDQVMSAITQRLEQESEGQGDAGPRRAAEDSEPSEARASQPDPATDADDAAGSPGVPRSAASAPAPSFSEGAE